MVFVCQGYSADIRQDIRLTGNPAGHPRERFAGPPGKGFCGTTGRKGGSRIACAFGAVRGRELLYKKLDSSRYYVLKKPQRLLRCSEGKGSSLMAPSAPADGRKKKGE